jgi:L-iditol 2-dehydrogenase
MIERTMRALVKTSLEAKAMELREMPVPKPGPGEVLLKVGAAAICGSDLSRNRGTIDHPMQIPVVMGHEFAGTVAALGHGVSTSFVGDRVVSETAARVCGQCVYCRSGAYNVCPQRKGFGYGVDGAFADYVSVPVRLLHHIPDHLPFARASLTEPAAGAHHGVQLNHSVRPGDPTLIIGPGPIGLFALQFAYIAGASPLLIAGIGRDRERLELARDLCADRTIDLETEDAREIVRSLGDGLGVQYVVEATGAPAALDLALDVVRPLGAITRIGLSDQPLPFGLNRLTAKAVTLQGTWSHTYADWERVLHLMGTGQLQVAPLVSQVYPLAEWRQAFEDAAAGRVVKAVLEP